MSNPTPDERLSDTMVLALHRIYRQGNTSGVAPITSKALYRRGLIDSDIKTGRRFISLKGCRAIGRQHEYEKAGMKFEEPK